MVGVKNTKRSPRRARAKQNELDIGPAFQPVDFRLVEWVETEKLVLDGKNPRIHTERSNHALARAIRETGVFVPIVVGDRELVLAGEGRIEAARLLGMKRVPVLRASELTEAQMRLFRVSDNKTGELSKFDPRLLAVEIAEIIELDVDISIEATGFELAEIDIMLDGLKEPAGEPSADTDPADVVPEPPLQATTRSGDVWLCGAGRVICGDSLQSTTYDLLLQGALVDLIVQDAPYNVSVTKHVGGHGKIRHREFAVASGELSDAEFAKFLKDQLGLIADRCRPGAVIASFMDWRSIAKLVCAGEAQGLDLINMCVWAKTNAAMGSLWRSQHELIAIFKKPGAAVTNNVQLGKFGRYRTNLWTAPGSSSFGKNRMKELGSHPTPKNVAMIADAIRDVTHRGERVLDNFLGSGTTLIAAERTGRIAYGIEIDPIYVDVAVRRWEDFTGRQARLEATGQTFAEVLAERSSGAPKSSPMKPSARRARAAA